MPKIYNIEQGGKIYKMCLAKDVKTVLTQLNEKIQELENELSELKANRSGSLSNLTPRKPKYSEEVQREIAKRVSEGESKNKLSKEYKVTRGTIANYVKRWGVDVPELIKARKSEKAHTTDLSLIEDDDFEPDTLQTSSMGSISNDINIQD